MKKEYDFSKGKRGAVDPAPAGKTRITIRLDNEIIDWFRNQAETRGGGNYQTMINSALNECIKNRGESLEETVGRVVRAEYLKLYLPFNPILRLVQTAGNKSVQEDIPELDDRFRADNAELSSLCWLNQVRTV